MSSSLPIVGYWVKA